MKNVLLAAALLGFATIANATGEVPDDSTWSGGGTTVTVDITSNSTANDVSVTFESAGVTSNSVTGTPGDNSSSDNPTCSESAESGGFRVKNGKVQRKDEHGTWHNMVKEKKPAPKQNGMQFLRGGTQAPHAGRFTPLDFSYVIDLRAGDVAPQDGWMIGEEVTSLPAL